MGENLINDMWKHNSLNKLFASSLLMIVLMTNSLAFAQTPSDIPSTPAILPDNPFGLYGLKTAIENIQTALTFNDTAKAQFEVKLAQERLAEIQAELQKGDSIHAQQAQQIHDKEVNDVESIADKQSNDNHGQQIKTFVHQLIADHDKNIGELVSQFAQNTTQVRQVSNNQNSTSQILQSIKSITDDIRQNHGDSEQVNPNVHANRRD